MDQVRIGIIGMGNIGTAHANAILEGKVKGAVLSAVCNRSPERLQPFPMAKHFQEAEALLQCREVDAVLIATPHFDHVPQGIAALEAGKHVLLEKPIAVHKAEAEQLIAAHTGKSLVFAAMFNQRTDPRYQQLKAMIDDKELGSIHRIHWTITDWFRTEAYYQSSQWRATWKGEGGGVLLNQCPHQLDLWAWLFGMPKQVRAFCQLGRFHDIEVEDAVTAYLEYDQGTTGVFTTTTGEAPGVNRLEIAADHGLVTVHASGLEFLRNDTPARQFSQSHSGGFSKPPTSLQQTSFEDTGPGHDRILSNFVDAILTGAPLIAPAEEGLHSIELANAMLLSHFQNEPLDLPLNASTYAAKLDSLIRNSTVRKADKPRASLKDFEASF